MPLRSGLPFQGFQHLPNCFCSTVEDWRVFEIEEIQPAERVGFPSAHFRSFSFDFLAYLLRQEIAEMSPEELFKHLQVAIVVAARDKALRAGLLPTHQELLQGVPLHEKGLALLLRFQRRPRLRKVAGNARFRNTPLLCS